MKYVEKLIQETDYLKQLQYLEKLEETRIYCRHGLAHLLDVARIAWIHSLEEGMQMEKEQVYLAALLHDMGRIMEYEHGLAHQEAGKCMAQSWLSEIGYPIEKCDRIVNAIGGHRGQGEWKDALTELIRWADKQSRNCFYCQALKSCNWSQEKRNQTIND